VKQNELTNENMLAMLEIKVDKIETIKSLLLARIEHYERQLADLRGKLKRVEDVEAMLPSLVPIDAVGVDLSSDEPKKALPGKPYSNLSLTESIKLALVHAGPTPKTLRELRNMLAHGGYEIPETGRFSSALNATLYRLESQGLITSSEDMEGRKTFMRRI
jgi:hypothetical protein